jgi:hypothetical protein
MRQVILFLRPREQSATTSEGPIQPALTRGFGRGANPNQMAGFDLGAYQSHLDSDRKLLKSTDLRHSFVQPRLTGFFKRA